MTPAGGGYLLVDCLGAVEPLGDAAAMAVATGRRYVARSGAGAASRARARANVDSNPEGNRS